MGLVVARCALAALLAVGALAACIPANRTWTSAGGGTEMPPEVAGPLPEGAEDWERDNDPLPATALVKFQSLARGPNVAGNYRWVLHDDGRLFVARNSADAAATGAVFDTALPATPTKTLPPATVKAVEQRLRDAKFATQPPYQANPSTQDGSWYIVTARLDGKLHEVIYDAYYPALVTYLDEIAAR
jgi:hypothetical protein